MENSFKKLTIKEKKEYCALKVKEDTGNFPIVTDWTVKNKYPVGKNFLCKLFKGYNNFRKYCKEEELVRTDKYLELLTGLST
tara:strand:- start:15592 stop:15837 length:246 start_codon:yes stop_codon:yes gene_type:complete